MASVMLTCEVRIAWWLVPYLKTLLFFCNLMGTEPDFHKLEAVIVRALRVKIGNRWRDGAR